MLIGLSHEPQREPVPNGPTRVQGDSERNKTVILVVNMFHAESGGIFLATEALRHQLVQQPKAKQCA